MEYKELDETAMQLYQKMFQDLQFTESRLKNVKSLVQNPFPLKDTDIELTKKFINDIKKDLDSYLVQLEKEYVRQQK